MTIPVTQEMLMTAKKAEVKIARTLTIQSSEPLTRKNTILILGAHDVGFMDGVMFVLQNPNGQIFRDAIMNDAFGKVN